MLHVFVFRKKKCVKGYKRELERHARFLIAVQSCLSGCNCFLNGLMVIFLWYTDCGSVRWCGVLLFRGHVTGPVWSSLYNRGTAAARHLSLQPCLCPSFFLCDTSSCLPTCCALLPVTARQNKEADSVWSPRWPCPLSHSWFCLLAAASSLRSDMSQGRKGQSCKEKQHMYKWHR